MDTDLRQGSTENEGRWLECGWLECGAKEESFHNKRCSLESIHSKLNPPYNL